MLAELAVSHPWRAFLVGREGQGIDEYGVALMELDVVGAGVLQAHTLLQGQTLDAQGGQGGVLQLGKAPLVGITDESHGIGFENFDRFVAARQIEGGLTVGNEQAFSGQEVIQPGFLQQIVVRSVGPIDLAEERSLMMEKESARVTERGGVGAVTHRDRRLQK